MSDDYFSSFYKFYEENLPCKKLFQILHKELNTLGKSIGGKEFEGFIYEKDPNNNNFVKMADEIFWLCCRMISFYRNFNNIPKIMLDDANKKYKNELDDNCQKIIPYNHIQKLINYIDESVCNTSIEFLEEIRFFGNRNKNNDYFVRMRGTNKNLIVPIAEDFLGASFLCLGRIWEVLDFLWNNLIGIKDKEIRKTKPQIIGKCSICSGNVICYVSEWRSIIPPAPTCMNCGAQTDVEILPVVKMISVGNLFNSHF